MHAAEITEADQTLEFIHRGGVAFRSFEVVAGGKGVAGVKTDSNAGLVFDAFDDVSKMLKPPAEVASLSGGVLDDGRHAFRFGKSGVDALRNQGKTLLVGDRFQRTARMKIQPVQTERHAAFHLADEGVERLRALCRIRVAHVDQIAVVGEYVVWGKTAFGAVPFEGGD